MHVRGGPAERSRSLRPIGKQFVYQSSVWKIAGMYLAAAGTGRREVWWILARQLSEEVGAGGEADNESAGVA